MNDREWMARALVVAASHHTPPQSQKAPDRLHANPGQELLADVDGLVRSAPEALLDVFRNWPEELFRDGAAARLNAAEQGRYGWEAESTGDPVSWLKAAVEQARALDEHLAFSSDAGDGPQADSGFWRAVHRDVFVVPCRRQILEGGEPRAGQPYSRRGLLYHRILPAMVGNLTVRPVQMAANAAAPPRDGDPLTLGAAMFLGAALDTRSVPALPHRPVGFLAERFEPPSAPSTLELQAKAAFLEGCSAAVWPELTMPPERRAAMRLLLALQATRAGSGSPLQVVVAGSWHDQDLGGGWRNVSEVCDRSGRVRLRYSKIVPFYNQDLGEEAIVRGDELPVLITEGLLIGFAICKDLCDAARPNPYLELPVDLLLVPSMGEGSTIEGHADAAKSLRLTNGTTVFVVQQALLSPGGHAGYALHTGVHRNPGERYVRQAGPWQTYGRLPPAPSLR